MTATVVTRLERVITQLSCQRFELRVRIEKLLRRWLLGGNWIYLLPSSGGMI